jgi:hypothetical protein
MIFPSIRQFRAKIKNLCEKIAKIVLNLRKNTEKQPKFFSKESKIRRLK